MLAFSMNATDEEGAFGLRQPYIWKARCALSTVGRCQCDWRGVAGTTRWRFNQRSKRMRAEDAFKLLLCNETNLTPCDKARGRELFPKIASDVFYKCAISGRQVGATGALNSCSAASHTWALRVADPRCTSLCMSALR